MDRQLINEEDKFLWLSRRDLKGDTESEINALQDQELQINIMRKNITNRNR